jgi:hypothetical protein
MYLLASTRPVIGKGKLHAHTGHKTDGKEERRSLSMHFLLGGVNFLLKSVWMDGLDVRSLLIIHSIRRLRSPSLWGVE